MCHHAWLCNYFKGVRGKSLQLEMKFERERSQDFPPEHLRINREREESMPVPQNHSFSSFHGADTVTISSAHTRLLPPQPIARSHLFRLFLSVDNVC